MSFVLLCNIDESTTVLIDLRVEFALNAVIITLIWCQQLFFIVLVVYGYVFKVTTVINRSLIEQAWLLDP